MEPFSKLLGHIYEAATDGGRWPAVLLEIATFAGATFAALSMEDVLDPLRTVLHLSSQDPDWTRLCQEVFLVSAPVGRLVEAMSETSEVVLTPHVVALTGSGTLQGGRRAVSVALTVLEKTKSKLAFLSLGRIAAQPDEEMVMQRNLELLAPHVRRAVSISQRHAHERRQTAALAETLNQLSYAVFLIDSNATIVHANDQAEALLNERHILSGNTGRLFLHEPEARAVFAQALQAHGVAPRDDVFIVGRRRGIALLGQVTSLGNATVGASAAFFIRPIRFDLPTEAARTALATVYALTRREIGVLTAVVEAGGAPEAARTLGLTPETIKAHLKSIFRKTGTHNQVDLVKLVSSAATLSR